jgi:adhesin/invasin
MAFNMVSVFMVTRLRRTVLLLGVTVSAALWGYSCERVPLLAPTGSTITLTTAVTSVGFNGSAEIIAQVLESGGTPPHSGTHLIFSTSLGIVDPADVQTDVNGRAVTRFRAGSDSGVASITATSGGAGVAAANAVKIAVGSAAVGAIVATANPATVSAKGGSSTITARVTDAAGNILIGIPVAFSSDFGSFSANVSTTDANGNATTVLTTARTSKVTATAGASTTTTTPPPAGGTGTGTTTTTQPVTATVTITLNATASITIGTPAPASPVVGQTVALPLTYGNGDGISRIVQLSVDWGDGRVDNYTNAPSSVSHAYSRAGAYLVNIVGFDALGDSSSATLGITVTPRPLPTVTITGTASATTPRLYTFAVNATPTTGNTITSVTVDFGDGNSTTVAGGVTSVQHLYGSANTYVVVATATETSGATGTGSTVIVVQ